MGGNLIALGKALGKATCLTFYLFLASFALLLRNLRQNSFVTSFDVHVALQSSEFLRKFI